MDIKITKLQLHNEGPIKVWVDIKIEFKPDQIIDIRDITVIDRGEGLAVEMPTRGWKNRRGELKTKHQVTLRGNLRIEVEAFVLGVYRAEQEKENARSNKIQISAY